MNQTTNEAQTMDRSGAKDNEKNKRHLDSFFVADTTYHLDTHLWNLWKVRLFKANVTKYFDDTLSNANSSVLGKAKIQLCNANLTHRTETLAQHLFSFYKISKLRQRR